MNGKNIVFPALNFEIGCQDDNRKNTYKAVLYLQCIETEK